MTEESGPRRERTILVRVGGKTYPAKEVPQCRTCRSKYRPQIEQGLISGMTYQVAVRELIDPYDDHSTLGTPSYQSLLNHVNKGHMPMPYVMQRRMLERRAEELGRSIEEGKDSLADPLAIIRSIVQTGFDMVSRGDLRPSMSELLKALQLQAAIEGGGEENTEDTWRTALITYMEIVQQNVSPEVFQRISRAMASSPVMKEAMTSRQGTVAGAIESGE